MNPHLTGPQFLAIWTAGVVLMFGTAIALRRARRLPFFKPRVSQAVLDENWCSAASSQGVMGDLGWARNCVWVVLTHTTLQIGPHFPFNLFLPRFFFGLELTIPLGSISSVDTRSSSFRGEQVRVTYTTRDDSRGIIRTEHLDLQPRRVDRFARVLQEETKRATTLLAGGGGRA